MTFPEVPLKRFGHLLGGATPTADPRYWDGDVTWYTPTDVSEVHGGILGSSHRTLTLAGLTSSGAPKVPAGSVIFTSRAPIGNVARSDRDCATNQGCKSLVPNQNNDARFIVYVATVRQSALHAAGTGTTFYEISAQRLGNVCFPMPPARRQHAIANLLDRERERIARVQHASERANQCARALLESQLHELVIEGDPRVSVGRLMTLQRGHDLPADDRSNRGYPVIGSGGVVGWHNRPAQTSSGIVTGRYGSVGAVHWIDGPHWPLNTTLYVRDSKGHDLRYLYWLLRALPLQSDASKSAVPGLHRSDVHRMRVRALAQDEMERVARRLDALEEQVRNLIAGMSDLSATLTEYRDALITEAVTGQLDVTAVSENQMDERMHEAIEAPR